MLARERSMDTSPSIGCSFGQWKSILLCPSFFLNDTFYLRRYKLANLIDTKIDKFIKDPDSRLKNTTPNIGDWLTYLTVSSNFRWEQTSISYIKENFLRNVMWYLNEQPSLANVDDAKVNATRIEDTFRLTKVSRDLLAFQVLFLDIARPKELTLKQVITTKCDVICYF